MSPSSFSTLNEKTSAIPIKSDLLAWCPTMDLIACVTDSDEIVLNRLSGQRVWNVSIFIDGSVQLRPSSIAWRPDGKVIAVGFDNGNLQYLDVNDGKTIQFLSGASDAGRAIRTLRWMEGIHSQRPRGLFDLSYDVRSQLPLLSPLPSSGIERLYTSKQAVQTLIHDLEKETDRLKFLSVGADPTSFRLLIGSFHLDLIQPSKDPEQPKLIGYHNSSDLALHAIISESSMGISMDLYGMSTFRDVDPVIKDLTNTFNDYQAVSLYLSESLDALKEEHNVLVETRGGDLDKLSELCGPDGRPCQRLFSFLLTGVPEPPVKEWLDNHLNERVVKKWEKSCETSLDNVRRLTFESCLPACDRLMIMASKLRGMAAETQSHALTELDMDDIFPVIKTIELLIAQLHSLARATISEIESFVAFCQWMVFAIAREAPDDENPDAAMPVETRKVVEYIRTQHPNGIVSNFFGEKEVEMGAFLQLEKDLNTLDPFPKLDGPECPTLRQTKHLLDSYARRLFVKPAEVLVKNWHHSISYALTKTTNVVFDSMFIDEQNQPILYLGIGEQPNKEGSTDFYIIRQAPQTGGIQPGCCRIKFDIADVDGFIIHDLKFIDDTELLVLLQSTGSDKNSHILAIEYRALPFVQTPEAATTICSSSVACYSVVPSKHKILDHGRHPIKVSVNGAKGRRTGLYLLPDRQRYTIFDLDDEADDEDDEEEDEFGSDDDDEGLEEEEEEGEEMEVD